MIDILYLVSTLRRSGPTNQLQNIVANLDTNKFSPTVLTLSPEPTDSAWEEFEAMDVRLESVEATRTRGIVEVPRYLRQYVSQNTPDIIHSQGVRPDVFSSYFLTDQTRVSTLRNYPYYDYPQAFGPILGKVIACTHLHSLQRLEHPIACSNSVRELVTQHGISMNAVPNGVNTEKFHPVSGDIKRQRRQKLNLPSEGLVFVSVGALSARKDPTTVVKGFLKSRVSRNGTLIFLGDGDQRESVESLAAGHDKIRVEGFVNTVAEYLQTADYFVSASTAEGLPNTVMEALACGLPVCLSSIGPHEEILKLDDKAGTMFRCRSTDELAFALEKIVAMDKGVLSGNARTLIENHLSAEQTSQKYQELYQNSTQKHTPG